VAQRQDATSLQRVTLAEGNTFREQLNAVCGTPERAAALLAEVMNMGRRVPGLHECSMESLAYGVMRMASLNLNPAIPNEVWLIPRKGQAELQYGYGALRKLVLRSPEVVDCWSKEVCANDVFEPPATLVSLPTHRIPPFVPRGPVIGYYNVLQKANGNYLTLMMSVAEVEAHRDRYAQQDSRGQYGSAWSKSKADREGLTNFDKMGLKTVLRMNCSPRNVSLTADVWQALAEEQPPTPVLVDAPAPVTQWARPELEAGKGLAEHLRDVTGHDAPGDPIATARASAVGQQIEALLDARGWDEDARLAFWRVRQGLSPDLTPGVLAMVRDELAAQDSATAAKKTRSKAGETQSTSSDNNGLKGPSGAPQRHNPATGEIEEPDFFDHDASAALDRELSE